MLTREEIVHCLEVEWGFPPLHFRGISEEQRAEMMSRMGYASYDDYLTGTICLWRTLTRFMREGQAKLTGGDPWAGYDLFAHVHVERLKTLPLPEILEQYDLARRELLDQVTTIDDSVITDPNLNNLCWLMIFRKLP